MHSEFYDLTSSSFATQVPMSYLIGNFIFMKNIKNNFIHNDFLLMYIKTRGVITLSLLRNEASAGYTIELQSITLSR